MNTIWRIFVLLSCLMSLVRLAQGDIQAATYFMVCAIALNQDLPPGRTNPAKGDSK